jgi:hypothetical protein
MNSRLPIAVLSQSSHTIGLFDLFRIHQTDAQDVTWIAPKRMAIQEWIRPSALISLDIRIHSNTSESIRLLSAPTLRLAPNGHITPNDIIPATLVRLSYNVSLWEHIDEYPLFSVFPDTSLQWNQTVRTTNPFLHIHQLRHYRLQNIPLTPSYMAFTTNPIIQTRTCVPPRELCDDVCPITLEVLVPGTTYWTPCGHPFSEALERALATDPRCPMCRAHCYFSECVLPEEDEIV